MRTGTDRSYLNPSLLEIPVRKTARPVEELRAEYGLGTMASLFANENPLGPSPRAVAALREAAAQASRYPGTSAILRGIIAHQMGL